MRATLIFLFLAALIGVEIYAALLTRVPLNPPVKQESRPPRWQEEFFPGVEPIQPTSPEDKITPLPNPDENSVIYTDEKRLT